MLRALPWPSDDDQGFINVHAQGHSKDGKGRFWTGTPTRDIDAFQTAVDQYMGWQPKLPDIFMCLSRQRDRKEPNLKGNIRAAKSAAAALAFRAIWLDVDVKKGAYATLSEALRAVLELVDTVGLPNPSALVASGGGLHVYWISDRVLTPREWLPYAMGLKFAAINHGLKCDAGVTGDAARVLRPPGTFNYKYDPPRPVRLRYLARNDYDFQTALAVLPSIAPPAPQAITDAPVFAGAKPPAAVAGMLLERLSDGIRHETGPVTLTQEMVKQCGFLQEALTTGGEKFEQGLWNLSTLAATFMEDGHALAHKFANKHPEYSHEETEEMWERKLAERRDKGLGWPSCKAIQSEGCTHCAACSHLSKRKSPLHLATPAMRPAPNKAMDQTHQSNSNPVATLMNLRDFGANKNELLCAMNQSFAVVKYVSKIMVASIVRNELDFMKLEDFHNMFANLVVSTEIETKDESGTPKKTTRQNVVSKDWVKWKHRRQYVNRGVVFAPGGSLEVENDMLNLWRGFGVEPKQGDWSLMRDHILNVVCTGNQQHFAYLIKWMAYGVQHPDRPIGVAIALRGEEGAGKGILWRNYGKLWGKHFKHVAQGEHLTGRFNAVLGDACAVFLDEALWAGDHKGEQILKALITEDTFQLERKFCDAIPVPNRLRIMIASNNDWIVPVGTKGRRYVVLDVSDQYADENDPAHAAYWDPLHAQFGNHAPDDGRAAMLYDLLHMDLSGFNIRAVPKSAAKTEQKLLSLGGTTAWLYRVLHDGAIEHEARNTNPKLTLNTAWDATGLTIPKADAYQSYLAFSKQRHEWQPEIKDLWSKKIRAVLRNCVGDTRPGGIRSFQFVPLADCRHQFSNHLGDPDLGWEEPDEGDPGAAVGQTTEDVGEPAHSTELQSPGACCEPGPESQAGDAPEYEPDDCFDAPDIEWEPEIEPDYWPEYEPEGD